MSFRKKTLWSITSTILIATTVIVAFPGLRTLEAEATTDELAVSRGIVTDVSISPAQMDPGDSGEVRVRLRTSDVSPDEDLFVRVQFGPHVRVTDTPSDPWACDEPTDRGLDTIIQCHVPVESKRATALKTLVFDVTVDDDVHGLRGISAIAWFGGDDPSTRTWTDTQIGPESDSAMLSIGVPHGTRPATIAPTIAENPGTEQVKSTTLVEPVRTPGDVAANRRTVSSQEAPSPAFCQLFAAASTVNTDITVGPITFSSMSDSSNSGGACSSTSVITLSGSNIAFGNIVFENVTGSISPATITFSMAVAGSISLTITGPFPDAGTEYTANLSFPVGSSQVTLDGVVDYSDNSNFSVTLSASETSSGWSPVPGVSMASGSATGTFTRALAGATTVDTFSVSIAFGGNWSPVPGITMTGVNAAISNTTGDLVIELGATLTGNLDLAGLELDMNATLTGSVDIDTERLTVTGSIAAFTIADLLTMGPVSATFTHDARNTGGSGSPPPTTANLSGSASFTGVLAQFFQGSVSTSIALLDEGYVVEAEMDSAPSKPGYQMNGPKLMWASLSNPLTDLRYAPSGSDSPAVPLKHQSGVAVAPFGVPQSLATALDGLGIDVLDKVGSGTLAFSLPPSDPSISIYYDAPPDTYLIGDADSSVSARFEDIFVSVSSGETESFAIGGDVSLTLSRDVLELTSALEITIDPLGASIDGYLELTDTSGWPNAFGMKGVTLYQLILEAGMADGLPSFAIEAAASFPSSLTSPLGIVNGSVITLGIDVSATNPCFLFAINAPPSNPNSNVLDLGSGTLTATSAQMVVAPDGCQIGTNQYSGFQLEFAGAIRGVQVGFNTSFTIEPSFSLTGSGYVGTFPLGGLTFDETTVALSISDTAFSLKITGGVVAGTSLKAQGELFLESSGGFSFSGNGTIKVGGDEFDVSVGVSNCADSGCSTLTAPVFWATGDIKLKDFTFDASIKVDTGGAFKATLEIPKSSKGFSFKDGSLNGSGTLTYSFYAEVSSDGDSEVKGSFSASLKSCHFTFISCRGARVSESADLKNGYANVKVSASYAGVKANISVTVR